MSDPFNSFVIFSEMRTGSNFLEANLNSLAAINCHGEAFNPHFIGHPNCKTLLGLSHEERDANPVLLLDRMREAGGLAGFRYFHDHDPRILAHLLSDRACAKIVLTRDPVPSYISWKIAQRTGQWQLTQTHQRKTARIHFDPIEFARFAAQRRSFRHEVMAQIRSTGQTVFHLTYDDLKSVDILNGLAAFLGVSERLTKLDDRLKVQNPGPLQDKVSNFSEMQAYLARRAAETLHHVPEGDVARQASVRSYVVGAKAPLLYLPIQGAATHRITAWLAALNTVEPEALTTGLSQNDLRKWKRANPGHRSFTVVRHPVLRAHDLFCRVVLTPPPDNFDAMLQILIKRYGGPPLLSGPTASWDADTHRAVFIAFLKFLDAHLRGQTALRSDPAWAAQARVIQGFSHFAAPDVILREEELCTGLQTLARHIGSDSPSLGPEPSPPQDVSTEDIYDEEIEALVARAYRRDYIDLGFGRWR